MAEESEGSEIRNELWMHSRLSGFPSGQSAGSKF